MRTDRSRRGRRGAGRRADRAHGRRAAAARRGRDRRRPLRGRAGRGGGRALRRGGARGARRSAGASRSCARRTRRGASRSATRRAPRGLRRDPRRLAAGRARAGGRRAASAAGPARCERAHHVEQAAPARATRRRSSCWPRPPTSCSRPAPATAARFHAAALRLLPDAAEQRDRRRADRGAARRRPGRGRGPVRRAGDAARGVADGAAPSGGSRSRSALANSEWWLGRTDDARRRLQVALGELPAEPSADRIRLRLALGLVALAEPATSPTAQAQVQRRARRRPRDRRPGVRGRGAGARRPRACVTTADGPDGAAALEESSAALERLTSEQLATRLPGALDARPRAPRARAVRSRRWPTSSADRQWRRRPGARTSSWSSSSNRCRRWSSSGRLADAVDAAERGARAGAAVRDPARPRLGAQRARVGAAGRGRRRRRPAPRRRGARSSPRRGLPRRRASPAGASARR